VTQTIYFTNLAHHFYTSSKKPESLKAVQVQPAPVGKKDIQVSVDAGTGFALACAVGMAAVAARCVKQRSLAYTVKGKRRGRSG
jgi:hypothetical protein